MRSILSVSFAVALLSGSLAAQALAFDDFTWTFSGPPSASGFVTSELLHVTGPSFTGCSNEVAAFTTTAPFGGTVRVHLAWQIEDICHFDWPLYTINGQVTKIPVSGDLNCFLNNGSYELQFDVQAGDSFGLGVGSSDCDWGPGLADFTNFTLLPPDWIDVGGALDPMVELEIAGTPEVQSFGYALAVVGDVDGDGLPEVAVNGSVGYPNNETVSLHSGADGHLLWMRGGPLAFGHDLVALGDVDGDAAPDVAVGSRVESTVYVISGIDGRDIWSWTWGGSPIDGYGDGLAPHADIDGDGVLELAVGSNKASSQPVRVFSGATGVQLELIPPGSGDGNFGHTLASAGDVDLDGDIDLMIAATGMPARVRVLSGATGAEILGLVPPPPSAGKWLWPCLAGAGDWNSDGVPDVAIGAPVDLPVPATGGQGTVTIFSGANESVLLAASAPAGAVYFGMALAGGVDVDGDALPDLAVGAPAQVLVTQPISGQMLILRAPDGAVLQHLLAEPNQQFGQSLAWYAEAPTPRLAVGVPAFGEPGRVRILDDLMHPAGAPQLSMYGAMQGGTPWTVLIDHGLPGNQAWLVFGLSELSAPFKGGVLVPDADLLALVFLDGDGAFEAGTTPPSLPPIDLWLQAWMPDAAGPKGWAATSAKRSP
jgi:FG-GAP repeat